MSYSCSDFTDTIIDALGIDVPEWANDTPSAQADFCLAAIARYKRIERMSRKFGEAVTPFIVDAIGSRNPVVTEAIQKLNEALKPLPVPPAADPELEDDEDLEHCDLCGEPLEPSQIGICDDCQASEKREED